MDNNDGIKSQQTGGLKLMTVFIAVLALHVVVIGGFTVYHLMSGGSTDADLANADKGHKEGKSADSSMATDSSLSTPSTPTSAPTSADPSTGAPTTAITATTTAAAPDSTTPNTEAASSAGTPTNAPATTTSPAATPTPATTPANSPASPAATTAIASTAITPSAPSTTIASPALTLNAAKPLLAPPPDVTTTSPNTPGPISPSLVPPADITQLTPAPETAPSATLTAPLAALGPVHMPPAATSAETPRVAHEHFETYTVKITDSYKKIARMHHVTVAELKDANHIHTSVLHTGQKLMIPTSGGIAATTVAASDLETTPTRTVMKETSSSETSNLASEPAASGTTGLHHHLYIIKKGDSLAKIAHRFKTTPLAIMEVNDIPDPAKLTIGKKLRIPSHETRAARIAPPTAAQPSAYVQPALLPPAQVQTMARQQPTQTSGQLANYVP